MGNQLLLFGDCIEQMKTLKDDSVDMVLADPPYSLTNCAWDSIIPFPAMWEQLLRVVKRDGAIVMTACQPFTSSLIASNYKMFKYCWVWEKTTATGHLNAKKRPMRAHEDIVVFYRRLPVYNPQKTTGHKRAISTAAHKKNCKKTECYMDHGLTDYDSTERYPRSVIKFSTDKQKSKLHPTQKPVALGRYLVRTYTNPGDTILDFVAGSGSFGVGAIKEGRKFIGIENDEKYFKIMHERLQGVTDESK